MTIKFLQSYTFAHLFAQIRMELNKKDNPNNDFKGNKPGESGQKKPGQPKFNAY